MCMSAAMHLPGGGGAEKAGRRVGTAFECGKRGRVRACAADPRPLSRARASRFLSFLSAPALYPLRRPPNPVRQPDATPPCAPCVCVVLFLFMEAGEGVGDGGKIEASGEWGSQVRPPAAFSLSVFYTTARPTPPTRSPISFSSPDLVQLVHPYPPVWAARAGRACSDFRLSAARRAERVRWEGRAGPDTHTPPTAGAQPPPPSGAPAPQYSVPAFHPSLRPTSKPTLRPGRPGCAHRASRPTSLTKKEGGAEGRPSSERDSPCQPLSSLSLFPFLFRPRPRARPAHPRPKKEKKGGRGGQDSNLCISR